MFTNRMQMVVKSFDIGNEAEITFCECFIVEKSFDNSIFNSMMILWQYINPKLSKMFQTVFVSKKQLRKKNYITFKIYFY